MVKSNIGQPRGILNQQAGEKKFQLALHAPAQDLVFFVEHYWIVTWDLRKQEPYLSEILPHPCVHLVIEQDRSYIVGVMTKKFSYLLKDKGRVFGIKFRPGAFYPFIQTPLSQLTDHTIALTDAFGAEGQTLEEAMLAQEDEGGMVACAESFLRARLPAWDENIILITRIIDRISTRCAITRVDEVASQLHLNTRMLQRLFSQYVGVTPKWVIKRYRLHEAAERLGAGEVKDWAQLALDLGYFDQAHFIKEFKAIVGKAPAEYVHTLASDR